MKAARKGIIFSETHRKKLSESHKGYVHTDQQKEKIAKALLGRKRGPMSDDAKLKMRLAKLGTKQSPETILKRMESKRNNSLKLSA